MPTVVACRFIGQADTGISRDNISNTFHFRYEGNHSPPDDTDNVLDMIEDLYCEAADPSSHPLGWWINSTIKRAARLQIYDLSDPLPRAPIAEREITIGGPGGGNKLPAEVALTCSFQGDRLSGESQSRRRGRIFLGPLNVTGTDMTIPGSTMIESINMQFNELCDAAAASVMWEWVVYSPTGDTTAVVKNGWVDNAWDTQRRRGPRATTRTSWP